MKCPDCGEEVQVQDSPFGFFDNVFCRQCKQAWYGLKEGVGENFEMIRLLNAAPRLHYEMSRYFPILERAWEDPELWDRLTSGTGIATLNGYRKALKEAEL